MELKLIVIRTNDISRLADFYKILGLHFEYHQHGNGPYHYSAELGQVVLEIYPLMKTQSAPDTGLRLGMAIDQFDQTISLLKQQQVRFIQEPVQTDFGFLAIIEDPDGRKIELYRN